MKIHELITFLQTIEDQEVEVYIEDTKESGEVLLLKKENCKTQYFINDDDAREFDKFEDALFVVENGLYSPRIIHKRFVLRIYD